MQLIMKFIRSAQGLRAHAKVVDFHNSVVRFERSGYFCAIVLLSQGCEIIFRKKSRKSKSLDWVGGEKK